MKKLLFYLVVPSLFLWQACQNEPATSTADKSQANSLNGLQLVMENNVEWQHGNLRIYPVVADETLIAEHAGQANIKTLDEAMNLDGFRITERKNFGRENPTWYNGLTLVNKSTDTVYMMSGDVVTGGNQDRVNADNLLALPGTIRNFDVFCVEHGRSSYYDPSAPESERKLAAFKGYYAVASPRVRRAVNDRDQSAVWGAVAQVTKENKAETSTQTYAGLEGENELKQQRQAYVNFFTGKFEAMDNVVGLIAVCNGQVIGAEVFGHPNLFQRRVKALIHSYAVEAATLTQTLPEAQSEAKAVQQTYNQLAKCAAKQGSGNTHVGRFNLGDNWLHVYNK